MGLVQENCAEVRDVEWLSRRKVFYFCFCFYFFSSQDLEC